VRSPGGGPVAEVVVGSEPGLGVGDVVRVARAGAAVRIDPAALERMRASRAVVERLAAEGRPIYGVTTGLGASRDVRVQPDDLAAFQQRILLGRAVGVGAPLPAEAVQATMLARCQGLAQGGAGAQPAVLEMLVAMLNRQVHPIVPSRGSIGTADMPPLAHLALVAVGLGEADYQGSRLPGAEALARAGLAPLVLGPKDGLCLVSANAATVGQAALALVDAGTLLEAAHVAAALGLEAFRGNVSPLDPRVQTAGGRPDQAAVAARIRQLLQGGPLFEPGAARAVQDPLSFRCVPQVHGAVRAVLAGAHAEALAELNAAADNPLVVAGDGEILSNGNFHTPLLALAIEQLRLALAQLVTLGAYRALKVMSGPFSGLPAFLTPRPGTRTGFATLQKTLVAQVAEVRHLANPASLDFLPVAEGVEDHATMAPLAVRAAGTAVAEARYVVAIELVTAAQATDLRARGEGAAPRLGAGTRAAYETIREIVAPLEEDRPIGPDVERLERLVASGALVARVDAALQQAPSGAGAPA
jgi:histidine ammonia-lyase